MYEKIIEQLRELFTEILGKNTIITDEVILPDTKETAIIILLNNEHKKLVRLTAYALKEIFRKYFPNKITIKPNSKDKTKYFVTIHPSPQTPSELIPEQLAQLKQDFIFTQILIPQIYYMLKPLAGIIIGKPEYNSQEEKLSITLARECKIAITGCFTDPSHVATTSATAAAATTPSAPTIEIAYSLQDPNSFIISMINFILGEHNTTKGISFSQTSTEFILAIQPFSDPKEETTSESCCSGGKGFINFSQLAGNTEKWQAFLQDLTLKYKDKSMAVCKFGTLVSISNRLLENTLVSEKLCVSFEDDRAVLTILPPPQAIAASAVSSTATSSTASTSASSLDQNHTATASIVTTPTSALAPTTNPAISQTNATLPATASDASSSVTPTNAAASTPASNVAAPSAAAPNSAFHKPTLEISNAKNAPPSTATTPGGIATSPAHDLNQLPPPKQQGCSIQ